MMINKQRTFIVERLEKLNLLPKAQLEQLK